uniref:Uncharacterized protein n=1 Tax=Schistosoma haematobium TaxID=6185 RepID=A0A094ZSS7_SCHHA
MNVYCVRQQTFRHCGFKDCALQLSQTKDVNPHLILKWFANDLMNDNFNLTESTELPSQFDYYDILSEKNRNLTSLTLTKPETISQYMIKGYETVMYAKI